MVLEWFSLVGRLMVQICNGRLSVVMGETNVWALGNSVFGSVQQDIALK